MDLTSINYFKYSDRDWITLNFQQASNEIELSRLAIEMNNDAYLRGAQIFAPYQRKFWSETSQSNTVYNASKILENRALVGEPLK